MVRSQATVDSHSLTGSVSAVKGPTAREGWGVKKRKGKGKARVHACTLALGSLHCAALQRVCGGGVRVGGEGRGA